MILASTGATNDALSTLSDLLAILADPKEAKKTLAELKAAADAAQQAQDEASKALSEAAAMRDEQAQISQQVKADLLRLNVQREEQDRRESELHAQSTQLETATQLFHQRTGEAERLLATREAMITEREMTDANLDEDLQAKAKELADRELAIAAREARLRTALA
jgi:chromosome segregation ATPase